MRTFRSAVLAHYTGNILIALLDRQFNLAAPGDITPPRVGPRVASTTHATVLHAGSWLELAANPAWNPGS